MDFKCMDKEAWLLDENVLYKGIVKRKGLRHIFIPNSHAGGFSYQYVKRKDLGRILFKDDLHLAFFGLEKTRRVYGDYIDESQLEEVVQKVRNVTGKEPIVIGKRK